MKKKPISSNRVETNSKYELTEKPKQNHRNLHLARGFSFSDHSHGRVNHHSIGYNHEPGTL